MRTVYLYIVLEFIEGKSLDEIVHVGGIDFIEESLLNKWSFQLYDIFEYLHSQNPPIIYRDLKPQNIMCRPDGQLCLIDFGIARGAQGIEKRGHLFDGNSPDRFA